MKKLIKFLLPKYLRFDRTQPFISITSWLAFLGVGIGVMVLCVAMAIMNGMKLEFEKRLFVMNYPINYYTITPKGINKEILEALKNEFKDFLFSPYLRYNGLSRIDQSMNPLLLMAVDIDSELELNEVFRNAFLDEKGILDREKITRFKNAEFPIIVGRDLATNNNLQDGDKILIFFSKTQPSGLNIMPLSKRFEYFAYFDSGLKAYNNGYAYTNIESLRIIRNLKPNVYDGIHIYTKNPLVDIESLRAFLDEKFPQYGDLEGWWEQNESFLSAMELEKRALFIVLMLIILMASLNIISSLLMVIMIRRKEIALMISLGMSKKEIRRIFFIIGAFIGSMGIVLGIILSGVMIFILDTFPIISLPADVYGTSKLPLDLSALDFILTIIGAFIVVGLSSYYPASQASKIDALKVLRNE